ncbi:hypothetical protein [Actinomyces vulturis]|uniref:hypothetical protein n=1 Tax=Actinomyces vulturis TaxID=1857645 RepID=UPI00159EC484|nr:hypothetical protein [Actinomyces vulturis]
MENVGGGQWVAQSAGPQADSGDEVADDVHLLDRTEPPAVIASVLDSVTHASED